MSWKQTAARLADRVLDPSIVLSFDRSGFRRHRLNFVEGDLEVDLRGRVCLVTGANSGLGFATAKALAGLGATVWLLCRSRERGQTARDAVAEIARGAGAEEPRLAILDISDLAAIRRFIQDHAAGLPRVDVLIHNAGVLPDERSVTAAGAGRPGLELTLATNLVGPFLLTGLLLPRMTGPDARLIHVSSGGMYSQKLRVDQLNSLEGDFDGVVAYARTKRAQVVLTEILDEMFANANKAVRVHSMHPGWADTPAVRSALPRFHRLTRAILRTPEEGADTVIWLAAVQPPPPGGRFWFDRRAVSTTLRPGTREAPGERARLFDALCRWTGLEADSFSR